jgi:hypothetical protein
MLKKMILGTALFVALSFVLGHSNAYSQTLSKEELKLMQDQMKDSLNSVNYIEKQAKLEKLLATPPATCGLESIDGLSTNSKLMIEEQKKTNDLLKTFVGKLTSNEDGQTEQQAGNKVSSEDILKLLTNVGTQLVAVTDATLKVTNAATDVTKLNPMKMGAGKKSLLYSKDAMVGLGTQLNTQSNILKQMQVYKQAIKNL